MWNDRRKGSRRAEKRFYTELCAVACETQWLRFDQNSDGKNRGLGTDGRQWPEPRRVWTEAGCGDGN